MKEFFVGIPNLKHVKILVVTGILGKGDNPKNIIGFIGIHQLRGSRIASNRMRRLNLRVNHGLIVSPGIPNQKSKLCRYLTSNIFMGEQSVTRLGKGCAKLVKA